MRWVFGIFLFVGAIGWAESISQAPSCLAATEAPQPEFGESPLVVRYWKFHKFAALGYRRDRQRFQEFGANALRLRTNYRNRNTVQLMVGSHSEWRSFIFDLRAGYGWLANGKFDAFNAPNGLAWRGEDLNSGYNLDARGTAGFRIKLYDQPSFGISIIPSGGYQYSHMMNWAKTGVSSSLPALGNGSYANLHIPRPNQQDWFGPLVAGAFELRFWEKAVCTLFYQYHLPALRSKSRSDVDFYEFDGAGALNVVQTNQITSVIHGRSLRTHLGGTDIELHHPSGWTFGIHFEGSATWSNTSKVYVHNRQKQLLPAPVTTTSTNLFEQAEVHWTQYSTYLFAGYKF